MGIFYNNFVRCSLEGDVLIGHEESHEAWSVQDWDGSSSVNIEVSPSFSPVGIEIFLLSSTSDVFVGGKNLLSKSSGRGFSESEDTGWLSIFPGTFLSIVLDDGSNEDIIRISSESSWGNSFISTSSEHTSLSWLIWWSSISSDGRSGGNKGDDSEFHYFNQTNYLLIISPC